MILSNFNLLIVALLGKIVCDADPNFYMKYLDINIGTPNVEESFNCPRSVVITSRNVVYSRRYLT